MRLFFCLIASFYTYTLFAWEYKITNYTGTPVLVKLNIPVGPDRNKWIKPGQTITEKTGGFCVKFFEVRGKFFTETQSNPNGGPLGCWNATVDIKYGVLYWDNNETTQATLPNNCKVENKDLDRLLGAENTQDASAGVSSSVNMGVVVGYNMEIQ